MSQSFWHCHNKEFLTKSKSLRHALWHQKRGPLLSQSQLTTCSLNHFAKYLVNLSSSLCCEFLPLWPLNTICYLHVVVVLLHCRTKNIKLFWIWPSIIGGLARRTWMIFMKLGIKKTLYGLLAPKLKKGKTWLSTKICLPWIIIKILRHLRTMY